MIGLINNMLFSFIIKSEKINDSYWNQFLKQNIQLKKKMRMENDKKNKI